MVMWMNPALFRHRVIFQEYDPEAKNENGFPLPEDERYKNFHSSRAMIKTLNDKGSAYAFYEAATTHAKNTNSFVFRYSKLIHDKWISGKKLRIIFKGRKLEVLSVINDNEANKTLTIVGREII